MMKRLMRSAAAIICAALFFWGAGCTAQSVNPEPQHTHTYSSDWSRDAYYHWHASTCGHAEEVGEMGLHIIEDGVCTVCGYARTPEHTRKPVSTMSFEGSYEIGDVRVQLLSDTLVRIENRTESGMFENRESWIVTNRLAWAGTEGELVEENGATKVVTENYTVVVPDGGDAEDVYILDADGKELWEYVSRTDTNVYLPSPSDALTSWYFTDSPRIIPSYEGYSPTTEEELQGWSFMSDTTDIFVFLPQGSYTQFCADYVNLTGRTEMVNLSTLGYWDSRYYAYTAETALQQIKDYRDRGYAIDVLVIDTDWRDSSGGWGYEINTDLFPDMAQFLKDCEDLGVEICFNDHPQPVEGTLNGLEGEEVDYRNEHLTLLLSLGVDYWWYDRNWSVALNSCDPEISVYAFGMYAYHWITEDYFNSIADIREYAQRAVIMGNVDGVMNGEWRYASDLAAHRYSIQWTGDTHSSMRDLEREIYTTILGGAEVGIPYMSSDLGGHVGSLSEKEYIRWIQYGMLSSVSRVHCVNSQPGRMPWLYGETAEAVFKTYQNIRYRLLPLYYDLARQNYDTGLPITRRVDIAYPQYAEAARNDEYLLGDYILIAPIAEASGNEASRTVFIPDGTWIDVWTGERFTGPYTYTVTHDINTSPIFVREGALVALARNGQNTSQYDWSEMTLDVYPSINYSAETRLYEDDTETVAYRDGLYRTTDISMAYDGEKKAVVVDIGAAERNFDGKLAFEERTWNIRVHKNPAWGELTQVKINGEVFSVEEIEKLAQDRSAKPFAYSGAAADGDIFTFTFSGSIREAYEIELYFSSMVSSGSNEDYDDSETPFTLSKQGEVSSVDLSENGDLGWVSYGDNGSAGAISEGDVFRYPEANVTGSGSSYGNSVTAIGVASGSVNKSYTHGGTEVENANAIYTMQYLTFEIDTVGEAAEYVLILGGNLSTAKVTVRDRAGNVQTVMFGDIDGEWTQKVVISCPESAEGTLQVTFSAVATSKQDTTSYPAGTSLKNDAAIMLYGCYAQKEA